MLNIDTGNSIKIVLHNSKTTKSAMNVDTVDAVYMSSSMHGACKFVLQNATNK
jgi:hypothetical protein